MLLAKGNVKAIIIIGLLLLTSLSYMFYNDKGFNLINENEINNETPNFELTFLALGDSYTVGQNVAQNERWTEQLVDRLKLSQINITKLTTVAQTGWTTSLLIDAIESGRDNNYETLKPHYDLVTLLIGVNNQYRDEDKTEFRIELTNLLYRAIEFSNGNKSKVIILSIPDWGITPFAEGRDTELISSEINAFNNIIIDQSQSLGITFVDITPISKMAIDDLSLIASDGLHPSGKMYKLWVDLIINIAKVKLA